MGQFGGVIALIESLCPFYDSAGSPAGPCQLATLDPAAQPLVQLGNVPFQIRFGRRTPIPVTFARPGDGAALTRVALRIENVDGFEEWPVPGGGLEHIAALAAEPQTTGTFRLTATVSTAEGCSATATASHKVTVVR